MDISALLEEVAGLTAFIESHPELPFAHLSHHAALAKHALETAWVEENGAANGAALALQILRAIAATTSEIPLETAIELGNVGLVALMIESGLIVNREIFLTACRQGNPEIVRLLIDADESESAANSSDALQSACIAGQTEVVRMLLNLQLKYGIDANNSSALYNASAFGHTEIVRLLLQSSHVIAVNDAFSAACRCGFVDIVGLFIDVQRTREITDENYYAQPLRAACRNERTEIVRLLLDLPLERGVVPAANDNVALRIAIEMGYTEIVRLFIELPLKRGVTMKNNDSFQDVFEYAIEMGYTEIVQMILDLPTEKGVDVAANDNLALRIACRFGRTEIVRRLLNLPLDRGVDLAVYNNAALQLACTHGHTEVVRMILDKGIYPTVEIRLRASNNEILTLLNAKMPWYERVIGCLYDWLNG